VHYTGVQTAVTCLLVICAGLLYAWTLKSLAFVSFWILAFAMQLEPPTLLVSVSVTAVVSLVFWALIRTSTERVSLG
jgi:tRNA A37 threonylcarbamoyladenosine modification protein TsaB